MFWLICLYGVTCCGLILVLLWLIFGASLVVFALRFMLLDFRVLLWAASVWFYGCCLWLVVGFGGVFVVGGGSLRYGALCRLACRFAVAIAAAVWLWAWLLTCCVGCAFCWQWLIAYDFSVVGMAFACFDL